MSLLEELKRRNVVKVGAAYLLVAWLVVQAASIGFPAFDAPPWALRVFILVLLLGFPIAVMMAWMFEVTPEGLKRDDAPTGTKRIVAVAVVLIVLAFAWYFRGQPTVRDSAIPAGEVGAVKTPAGPAAEQPKSIAVLPFVNMSDDRRQPVLLRRHQRGIAQRAGEGAGPRRGLAHFLLRLQGQGHGRGRDRARAQGQLHPRRQRAQGRRQGPHHRAADRRRAGPSHLVGNLRPPADRHLRHPGRDRQRHRRRLARFADAPRRPRRRSRCAPTPRTCRPTSCT